MNVLKRIWDAIRVCYFFVKPIRFVLIPLLLLLYALIWSAQGQDSVRALVEVDRDCPRFGRLAIFLLITFLTALQAWYWSRQLLRVDRVSGTAREYARAERLVPRVFGIAVFLIAIAALGRSAWLGYSGGIDFTMQVIIGTIVALLIELALFVVLVILRRRRMGESERVETHEGFAPITRYILRATVVVAAIFVIWTALSPLSAGWVFQSPSLLMLSAALWAGVGSWLAYWFDSNHVPLAATFLILAVVFSCFNDNHTVRTLTASQGGALPSARRSVDATFNDWYTALAARYANEPRHPVFIVATEGGGIRAAYWTASVLTAIHDRTPDFAPHLFAISSVSGGSVGATVFTALLADRQRNGAVGECAGEADAASAASARFAAQQVLSYDFLAPTLGSMLHADLVQRFLPIGFIPDRAKALETGWERGWRSHVRANNDPDDFFSTGFVKMYEERRNSLLPSLFLNGTSVEVGNRLIGSNCDLWKVEPQFAGLGVPIPDAVDLFDQLGRDMRLSTAAHNSARFTYVSPAGTVHADGGSVIDHVVDGGYFENSGAQTASDVMNRLTQIRGDRPYDLYLILIRFQQRDVDGANHCQTKPQAAPPPEKFMNEVMSPLRALLATRGARGTLAYAEGRRSTQIQPPAFEFILTQTDKGIVMPLGWLLARRTRNAIDLQVGPKTPPDIDCAIKPWVDQNAVNLNTIAARVTPQLPPADFDPVQKAAMESERKMKQ
jgi:hypothetical protein